jgi:hypothetical protein
LILKIKKQRHKIGEKLTNSPNGRLDLPSYASVLASAQRELASPIFNVAKILLDNPSFPNLYSRQTVCLTLAYDLQKSCL